MVAKTSRSITQHVFATFTYKREGTEADAWRRVTTDFNRFITYYRRLHPYGVEYLRTVEAHADCYPHIHAVLQHKHGILVSKGRYFDSDLYKKWKALWERGHADFQTPLLGSKYPVLYIIKYISKASTSKTLWKKMYKSSDAVRASGISVQSADRSIPDTTKPSDAMMNTNVLNPNLFFCSQFKIKQCTWSRKFEFPTIERMAFPEPPQCLLTAPRK